MDFGVTFGEGLEYDAFLKEYGTPEHRDRWAACHDQIKLTSEQQALLNSFIREMRVLVLAGTWCGDCVNQCPIFSHFAASNEKIQIRFFDRDAHAQLAEAISTCGAHRVPSVLFLSEDNHVCARYGDRTLAKYRNMAATQLGPVCPTGLVREDQSLLDQVVQEWLDEFERVQLMLRLSGRLRQLHAD